MPDFPIPTLGDLLVIGPPALLAVWGTALMLIDLWLKDKRVTAWIALLGLAAAALLGLTQFGAAPTSAFSGMAISDDTAIVIDWILALVAALTIVLSIDYNRRQGIEMGEYYTIVLLTTSGMMLMAHSTNLIVLFVALEWLSIGLYILAGFAYPRLRSQEAAMKYLLYGAFAAGFLIYGIALIYGMTGTTDLESIGEALVATPALLTSPVLLVGAALLLIGFGYKISAAPFHMWTPDVYEGSPTPVTAYMSAATKAAGFAALLRVVTLALPELDNIWQPTLAAIAALTMVVGNIAAVAQRNIKRMLAYSSIGHAGFILCALPAIDQPGALQAYLYYILVYSITNLGAFAVVIALEQVGEESFDIGELAGMGWRQPWLGVGMAVFMGSLAGVPPMAGFFAKWLVFQSAYRGGYWWLALVGLLTSIISAFYYLRIVVNMWMREGEEQPGRNFATSPLLAGVAVTAALLVVLGILVNPTLGIVGQTVASGN